MTKYTLAGLFIWMVPAMADVVTVSPDKLDFGDTVLTTRAARTAILANPTKKTLNISSITADGDFLVWLQAGAESCGSAGSPHQQCSIFIIFTPSGGGLRNRNPTVPDDSGDLPPRMEVSWTRVARPH